MTFTPDQVVDLLVRQTSTFYGLQHPYPCPNRDDKAHREIFGGLGVLLPTVRGWICPFCDYMQDRAYETKEVKS